MCKNVIHNAHIKNIILYFAKNNISMLKNTILNQNKYYIYNENYKTYLFLF